MAVETKISGVGVEGLPFEACVKCGVVGAIVEWKLERRVVVPGGAIVVKRWKSDENMWDMVTYYDQKHRRFDNFSACVADARSCCYGCDGKRPKEEGSLKAEKRHFLGFKDVRCV